MRSTPAILLVNPVSALLLLGLAVTQDMFSLIAASRRRRILCAAGGELDVCRRKAPWLLARLPRAPTSGAGRGEAGDLVVC